MTGVSILDSESAQWSPRAVETAPRLLAMLYSAFVFAYMPAAGLSLNSRDAKTTKAPQNGGRCNCVEVC